MEDKEHLGDEGTHPGNHLHLPALVEVVALGREELSQQELEEPNSYGRVSERLASIRTAENREKRRVRSRFTNTPNILYIQNIH